MHRKKISPRDGNTVGITEQSLDAFHRQCLSGSGCGNKEHKLPLNMASEFDDAFQALSLEDL